MITLTFQEVELISVQLGDAPAKVVYGVIKFLEQKVAEAKQAEEAKKLEEEKKKEA